MRGRRRQRRRRRLPRQLPDHPNPGQADSDGDGVGDACQANGPVGSDKTPPETTISKVKLKRARGSAKVVFTSSEPGSSFTCKLDKKRRKGCTSPLKIKRLKPGRHKLSVIARDAAGNVDPTPAVAKFKIKRPRSGK